MKVVIKAKKTFLISSSAVRPSFSCLHSLRRENKLVFLSQTSPFIYLQQTRILVLIKLTDTSATFHLKGRLLLEYESRL